MSATDALITIALFVAAFGLAGVACWFAERRLQRKQADWRSESNARATR